jgi:hypothetical protein
MKPRTLTRLFLFCLVFNIQPFPFVGAAEETLAQSPAPAPEELISALGRCAKPDWASKYRPPLALFPNNRAQIALLVGGLFSDGYLGAQAEDAQQCRNVGKDIFALAKTLGVQTELLDHSRSLGDSAQKKDWPLLRRELRATETDLCAALKKHDDAGLAHLISLGAWMRSAEIVASLLKDSYSENTAEVLQLPGLNRFLASGLQTLNEKLRADPVVTGIQERLDTVAQLLNPQKEDRLSQEQVNTIALTLGSILQDINSRQN